MTCSDVMNGKSVRGSKIRARAASSGMPMAISRSKRPARRSAGSKASGRFLRERSKTIENHLKSITTLALQNPLCEAKPAARLWQQVSMLLGHL